MKKKVPAQRVWERVREALEHAGLDATQKYAAHVAGIAQASVSGWNVEGNNISIDSARKISAATGIAVEWLVTGAGPKYIGPPNEDLALELWRLWPYLSDAVKGRLVGIAGEHAVLPTKERPSEPAPGEERVLRLQEPPEAT